MRSSRLLFLHTEPANNCFIAEHQNESNRRNLRFERNHGGLPADWLHNLPAHVKSFSAEQALNMSDALGACPTGWEYPYQALPYKDSVEVEKSFAVWVVPRTSIQFAKTASVVAGGILLTHAAQVFLMTVCQL